MSTKFIFSGRARHKLQELYHIWVHDLLETYPELKRNSENQEYLDKLDKVLKKSIVPDISFTSFFEFAVNNKHVFAESTNPLLIRLYEAISATKSFPKNKTFGRAFRSKDANHVFSKNANKDTNLGGVSANPSGNFYCFLITGMEIDEFEVEGCYENLVFEEDIKGSPSKGASPSTLVVRPSKVLTTLPGIDFNTKIVKRLGEIKSLDNVILNGKNRIQLYGIGGTGKSILALNYIQQTSIRWANVIWVEQSDDIMSAFTSNPQLRESLHINVDGDETNEELFIRIMYRIQQLHGRTLIIIDNAQSDISHRDFTAYFPYGDNWTLLVTARQPLSGFEHVEVDRMARPEALELFRKHYTGAISASTEKNILEVIEFHPLMIELTGRSLMFSKRVSPEGLLEHFKSLTLDSEQRTPLIQKHGKEDRILGLLSTTFNLIEEDFDPFSLSILKNFAVLVPQVISISDTTFLFGVDKELVDQFHDAIHTIYRKGWVSLYRKMDSIQIHRLIRDMLYYRFKPDPQDLKPMISQLSMAISSIKEGDYPITLFKWAPYANHLTLIMRGEEDAELEELNNSIITLLGVKGQVDQAIERITYQIETLRSELGEFSVKICDWRSNLAHLYLQNGNYAPAIEALELAIKGYKHTFGDKDVRVFASEIELASCFIIGEAEDKGIGLLEGLLPSIKKNLGANHHLIQKLKLELCHGYEVIGRLTDAETIINEVIEEVKSHEDELNYALAKPLTIKASILHANGKSEEALIHLDKVLKIELLHFGDRHPHIGICYSELGKVSLEIGYVDEAIEFFDSAIEIIIENYGEVHQHLIIPLGRRAHIYQAFGEFVKAEEHFLQALRVARKHFPETHIFAANCLRDLADFYTETDRFDKSITLLTELLEKVKDVYGEYHPFINALYLSLGSAYESSGDSAIAKSYFNKSVEIQEQCYGKNHIKTMEALSFLGGYYIENGEDEEALLTLDRAYKIAQETLEVEHPKRIGVMADYASALDSSGKFNEAKEIYEESLALMGHVLGKDHTEYLVIAGNYAIVLGNLQEYQKAEQIFRDVLQRLTKDGQRVSGDSLIVQMNLAKTLLEAGDSKRGEQELKEVIKQRIRLLTVGHPETFSTVIYFIEYLDDKSRFEEAKEYLPVLQEMLEGEEVEYLDELEVLQGLSFLGKFYMDDTDEACYYNLKAFELSKELLGIEHEFTKMLKNRLDNLGCE